MFGSTIIDVAIGLIFVFFLLSVIASHINELVSGLMQWRSKDLEAGVRQLLSDPTLADKVWNHSLVRGLSGRKDKDPAYIPPNTFALALFDAIAPGGNHPSAVKNVREQAAALPESSARQAILSILDSANDDVDVARKNVETWFDSAMGRVSAAYKQRMQILTILVAALVTLIFGADSLAIGNALWQEPSVRAAVTGAAYSNQAAATGVNQPAVNLPNQSSSVQETIKTISQQNLPLGWTAIPNTVGGWIQKVIGLVLTMAAVSLGAPFWYQLLQQLTQLRQTSQTSPQKT